MKERRGFTLTELLIVVMIVAVLAAVSLPMMRGNLGMARATEAVAALGAIRTQMRLMFAETGSYLDIPNTTDDFVAGAKTAVYAAAWPHVPGFNDGDLDGTYYLQGDYTITVADDDHYVIDAAEHGDAPAVQMNQAGTITYPEPE